MIYCVSPRSKTDFIGNEVVAVHFAVKRPLGVEDLAVAHPHVSLLDLSNHAKAAHITFPLWNSLALMILVVFLQQFSSAAQGLDERLIKSSFFDLSIDGLSLSTTEMSMVP